MGSIPVLQVGQHRRITEEEVFEDKVFGRPPKRVAGKIRFFYAPPRMFGVYFVQAGVDGPIKIGRSGNIGRRFDALQEEQRNLPQAEKKNTYDDELYIRLIIALDPNLGEGVSKRAERLLHRVFRFCRLKGEWFEPHDALAYFIDLPLMWPLLLDWLQSREDLEFYPLEAFNAYVSTVVPPLGVGEADDEDESEGNDELRPQTRLKTFTGSELMKWKPKDRNVSFYQYYQDQHTASKL